MRLRRRRESKGND